MTNPRRLNRATAGNLLLLAPLLVLTTSPLFPLFADYTGIIASVFGVAAGLAVSVLSGSRSWSPAPTMVLAFTAHLVGGALLLAPSLGPGRALRSTIAGTITVWKDFLTVSPPVSAFDGMVLLPWMLTLIASLIAGRLVIASRTAVVGIPVFILFTCAILWGPSVPRFSSLAGTMAGCGILLLWQRGAVQRERDNRIDTVEQTNAQPTRYARMRPLLVSSTLLVIAVLTALSVSIAPVAGRHVLRDTITPPLNFAEYSTPLSLMRLFETDLASTQLMHVDSPSENLHIRIATLDSYDGRNALIGDESAKARFEFLGPRSSLADGTAQSKVTVTIDDYAFPWVPTVVTTHSLSYSSSREPHVSPNLYYDPLSGTLLLPAGTMSGDVIVEATSDNQDTPSDGTLELSSVASSSTGTVTNIPPAVSSLAAKIVGSESDPLRQIRALQQRLTLSYYSDGTQSPSMPGHGAVRLSSMAKAPDLVGDDEQYAVLMMLMCHSLRIPARVAMGFVPSTDGDPRNVTGEDVHAWVEIPFTGIGWLPFDVTPDRDRLPQQQTTEKVSNPEPQVLQPPLPPPDSARLPPSYESEDDPRKDLDERTSSLTWAFVFGTMVLILTPPAFIVIMKTLRRSYRRSLSLKKARSCAAWHEVMDRAQDYGYTALPGATRRETAARLDQAFPGASLTPFGEAVDRCVFSDSDVSSYGDLWDSVDVILPSMSVGRPWWQRVRARISLRSLLHPSGGPIRSHPRRKN